MYECCLYLTCQLLQWGALTQWLDGSTDDQEVCSSNPLAQLGNLAISFIPHFGWDTLKADSPCYLVSMPGEVKDSPKGVNV